jgi:hypothetical protein
LICETFTEPCWETVDSSSVILATTSASYFKVKGQRCGSKEQDKVEVKGREKAGTLLKGYHCGMD